MRRKTSCPPGQPSARAIRALLRAACHPPSRTSCEAPRADARPLAGSPSALLHRVLREDVQRLVYCMTHCPARADPETKAALGQTTAPRGSPALLLPKAA